MDGKLILEDGSTFDGELVGDGQSTGEVVFNTGMTGYQEILTDPSYCRQIVTLTYPLVGNYGAAKRFMQSERSFVAGFVIGDLCRRGENCCKEEELSEFLRSQGIPCLAHVDTRAVTRRIRSSGTMKGVIVSADAEPTAIEELLATPIKRDVVAEVTVREPYTIEPKPGAEADAPFVVAMDFGVKRDILESMHEEGFRITVVPAHTRAEEILSMDPQPDGIFLSNGPGDPKDVPEIVEEIKKLAGKKPMFGICLGHQLLALAFGADTYKLKFGHRGSNQPVKDLATGRVYISSQNHGYAVDEKSLSGLPLAVTHISVNDGTVEGMRHTSLPIWSVQYHPEASPGPDDNRYLFDEFRNALVKGAD